MPSIVIAAILLSLTSICQCNLDATFQHGVASGDFDATSIVLWTRVTTRNPSGTCTTLDRIEVRFQVSKTEEFDSTVLDGVVTTHCERDWTVKVLVEGLDSATVYYYRFQIPGNSGVSPVGEFHLPQPLGTRTEHLRYAVLSCSNFGWGYFNAYDIARFFELDFWIHLGDYIYETAVDTNPNITEAVRYGAIQPKTALRGKSDYEQRYQTYHTDPGLQALRRKVPLIAVWDEHEIADDVFLGQGNNQANANGGTNYKAQAENAIAAYHEWIPTRTMLNNRDDGKDTMRFKIYRSFHFGDLLSLFMLETRLTERSDPHAAEQEKDAYKEVREILLKYGNPPPYAWDDTPELVKEWTALKDKYKAFTWQNQNTLLGPTQLGWLTSELTNSVEHKVKWQALAQQTVMQNHDGMKLEHLRKYLPDDPDLEWEDLNWQEIIWNTTWCVPGMLYQFYGNQAALYNLQSVDLMFDNDTNSHWSEVCVAARTRLAVSRYNLPVSFDDWRGYHAERKRFLDIVKATGVKNGVVYSADLHNAIAGIIRMADGELVPKEWKKGDLEGAILAEYVATGVTAPGLEWEMPQWPPAFLNKAVLAGDPETMRYANMSHRGFLLVKVDHDQHTGEYIYVSNVASENYYADCPFSLSVPAVGNQKDRLKMYTAEEVMKDVECADLPNYIPYCSGLKCPFVAGPDALNPFNVVFAVIMGSLLIAVLAFGVYSVKVHP